MKQHTRVTATSMAWLSSLFSYDKSSQGKTLGILAFEAARSMSRLIYLYKSLSDEEFFKLKTGPMRSKALSALIDNFRDKNYVFHLVYADKLQDLDSAASTVSRLAKKCSDERLHCFDLVYSDIKRGFFTDLGKLEYNSKAMEKNIKKMERYIAATRNLHSLMGSLRKIQSSDEAIHHQFMEINVGSSNFICFDEKSANHRKQIRHCKDISLWSKSFDKVVAITALTVSAIYARMCFLFGPYVPNLPRQFSTRFYNENPLQKRVVNSGSVIRSFDKVRPGDKLYNTKSTFQNITSNLRFTLNRSFSTKPSHTNPVVVPFTKSTKTTVGDAGLTTPYAHVIVLAETYLRSPMMRITNEARAHVFALLPTRLKSMVRRKSIEPLEEGWMETVQEKMKLVGPIGRDTIMWLNERNLVRQRIDAKPSVLLLQTLHYADLEKTEYAIADILVGLSCMYRFENRRFDIDGPNYGDLVRMWGCCSVDMDALVDY